MINIKKEEIIENREFNPERSGKTDSSEKLSSLF